VRNIMILAISRSRNIFLIVALLIYPFTLSASEKQDDVMSNEIAFLLSKIKHTACQLNRNGSLHNGQNAEKHIRRKYNYVRKKIKTTEQFISYAATRSSFTGRPYMLICSQEKPQTTASWLLKALSLHRKQNSTHH